MRPISELRFIAARVWAEIRANPPRGPLLGEADPETCRRGHTAFVRRADGRRRCSECDRQRPRGRRAEVSA